MTGVVNLLRRAVPRIAPRRDRTHMKLRLRVLAAALANRAALRRIAGSDSAALNRICEERPETVIGPLVWPYLCAAWTAPQRLERLQAHYRIIDRLGAPFPFPAGRNWCWPIWTISLRGCGSFWTSRSGSCAKAG